MGGEFPRQGDSRWGFLGDRKTGGRRKEGGDLLGADPKKLPTRSITAGINPIDLRSRTQGRKSFGPLFNSTCSISK